MRAVDLVLAEQLLLLALDDVKGNDTAMWGSDTGLAAALLLDLGAHDLLRVEPGGTLLAVDPLLTPGGQSPEHALLAEAHRAVRAEDPRRTAKDWLHRLPRALAPLRDRVAGGLVERGVLSEERTRVLGLFPRTRFPAADDGPERRLREALRAVLVAGRAPTEQEALLLGLLEPLGRVDQLVDRDERRAARRRAQELGEQGLAGDAVRQTVRELQASVIVAALVVPAATGASSG